MASIVYLDNFGRDNFGVPNDSQTLIDLLDPDFKLQSLDVKLLVSPLTDPKLGPEDAHWAVIWDAGQLQGSQYTRRIEIVQEYAYRSDHLTNWGPRTKVKGKSTGQSRVILIDNMSLDRRNALEAIAAAEKVRDTKVGGPWNCQNWLISVFEKAEAQQLLTNDQWTSVVRKARESPQSSVQGPETGWTYTTLPWLDWAKWSQLGAKNSVYGSKDSDGTTRTTTDFMERSAKPVDRQIFVGVVRPRDLKGYLRSAPSDIAIIDLRQTGQSFSIAQSIHYPLDTQSDNWKAIADATFKTPSLATLASSHILSRVKDAKYLIFYCTASCPCTAYVVEAFLHNPTRKKGQIVLLLQGGFTAYRTPFSELDRVSLADGSDVDTLLYQATGK